jgi:hypothetical protein
MRTLPLSLLFLGSATSLLTADLFVGTWTLNVGKSKPAPAPPGTAVKEETVAIEEIGERLEVTVTGKLENGSAISARYSHPAKGGLVRYPELPAGTSEVVKRINDSTLEFIRSRDGKVIATNHVTLSADGKMMRIDSRSVDAQGQPVQVLYVLDRQ